jgi:hypothetical protein
MVKRIVASLWLLSATASLINAQNSNPMSLLPDRIIDEIIGEISGETAMNHIIEMGAYNHNRPASEYSGNFFETDYVTGKLREYNLDGVTVYRYPGGSYWDGIRGELWETSPGRSKLADYDDLTAMLAQGSTSCDIMAPLVWVGGGSAKDMEGIDVTGKIVVTSGSPGSVHGVAVEKGALGVISYYSPRPLKSNIAIPITGISGRGSSGKQTFAFFLPPREGELLRDRLLRGEKIEVHAVVESQMLDYEIEVPSCIIPGTNKDGDEIILSAHLFEGYVKQGANDNISGSAALIEVARALRTMIDEGRIPQPSRTIRFIWVPEFSGTIPWVVNNGDIIARTLCNINLDMVGLHLAGSGSFLTLQRTTFGNAHYVNDVVQNFFEYVGITNREGLAISGRGGFTKRIVAPSGSDDPFYFQVDDHYGSSDHEVFNDPAVNVPGVMLITWPDLYYHTSQDRADKCDPTEMKRVGVITAASVYTIAAADEFMAVTIAGEITANGTARIGHQLARAIDMIGGADDNNFESLCRLGRSYITAATLNEKATLKSTLELAPAVGSYIDSYTASIDASGKSAAEALESYIRASSARMGVKYSGPTEPRVIVEASGITPSVTKAFTDMGYGASRTISSGMRDYAERYPVSGRPDISELLRLADGGLNLAQIKSLLDAQMMMGEADTQSLINSVKILKEMGYVTFK